MSNQTLTDLVRRIVENFEVDRAGAAVYIVAEIDGIERDVLVPDVLADAVWEALDYLEERDEL